MILENRRMVVKMKILHFFMFYLRNQYIIQNYLLKKKIVHKITIIIE